MAAVSSAHASGATLTPGNGYGHETSWGYAEDQTEVRHLTHTPQQTPGNVEQHQRHGIAMASVL